MFFRKAVASTSMSTIAARLDDLEPSNHADRVAPIAIGRPESGEIVFADKGVRRGPHRDQIQRFTAMPAGAGVLGGADKVIPDSVSIDLAARRKARVERGCDFRDVDEREIGGQD